MQFFILKSSLRLFEVINLEEEILDYLDLRSEVYEEFPNTINNPKPKTHYLSHYPMSFLKYGPPVAYWTARFESKNRIGKMIANSGKNFVNISKTVTQRMQMRQASVYYKGSLIMQGVPANVGGYI